MKQGFSSETDIECRIQSPSSAVKPLARMMLIAYGILLIDSMDLS